MNGKSLAISTIKLEDKYPTQRFSLDPRQYVCSAVENTDGETRELGCRMRAESEPSVEAEL